MVQQIMTSRYFDQGKSIRNSSKSISKLLPVGICTYSLLRTKRQKSYNRRKSKYIRESGHTRWPPQG